MCKADVAKRVWAHRREAEHESTVKAAWLNHLHAIGLTCEYCVLATIEPGYHVIEMEARWICEGIKRGWPLLNNEATDLHILRHVKRKLEEKEPWTCSWRELPVGHRVTMARIQAYARMVEAMPPALPHRFVYMGADGIMAHERP